MVEKEMQGAGIHGTIIEFVNKNFLMGTKSVSFTNDDSFIEKGIIDSTGVLEMVNFIQERFNVIMEDHDLIPENLDSVNNIVSFINKKRAIA